MEFPLLTFVRMGRVERMGPLPSSCAPRPFRKKGHEMKLLRKIFRPKISVVTFRRKSVDARKRIHDVCDLLDKEGNRPVKNWKGVGG